MDQEFNAAENMTPDSVPADVALDTAGQDEGLALSEILNAGSSAEGGKPAPQGGTQTEDPKSEVQVDKGFQGRVNALVSRKVAEIEEKLTAQYSARLEALENRAIDREADELVSSGEFKSRERAVEYLRMKRGQPAQETQPKQQDQKPAQPRDDKGRFTAPEPERDGEDPVRQRAELLMKQNEQIKAQNGLDVLALYKENPKVQEKVHSGEWDFRDVALAYYQETGERSGPPAPVRQPNNANAMRSFTSMSEKEMAAFDAMLASGKKFDARR